MQPPDTATEIERVLDRPPSETRRRYDEARALLRDLAERDPARAPTVSAFFDLRRPGDAADPASRETRIVLRRRRDEIAAALPKHGPVRESFDADAERIEGLLDEVAERHERGLAVYACHAEGRFASLLTWTPFDPRVEAGDRPVLVPLARFVDHEPAVLALVDTNTLRLWVAGPGRLEEVPAIDDDPAPYNRTDAGSPAQAEHRVDELRRAFARRAADLVARTMVLEEAERLVLSGPEAATTLLRDHLPKASADRLRATIHVSSETLGDIEDEVLPLVARLEAEDATDAADRLIGAVAAKGAAVVGVEATRDPVAWGQGLELLVDETGPAREGEIEELVRLAAAVGTRITWVAGHARLAAAGGVGALLRYRAAADTSD